MLEREGKKPGTYTRDNKAYMNMLNRLYTASKEGKFKTSKNNISFCDVGMSLCSYTMLRNLVSPGNSIDLYLLQQLYESATKCSLAITNLIRE